MVRLYVIEDDWVKNIRIGCQYKFIGKHKFACRNTKNTRRSEVERTFMECCLVACPRNHINVVNKEQCQSIW